MTAITSALVTGSNRGIGLELVRQLATRRPPLKFVFATCRNPSEAKDLQTLAQENENIRIIKLDAQDQETLKTAESEVRQCVGDLGLDLLINNAAILLPEGSLEESTAEVLRKTLDVNAIGPLLVSKIFLPLMRQAVNQGSKSNKHMIVNITSRSGSTTKPLVPLGTFYAYQMSKAALNNFNVQLASDLKGEGITVISVCPGWVNTDMGGPDALLTPQVSVSGIVKLIDTLSIEGTGKFYTNRGDIYPW